MSELQRQRELVHRTRILAAWCLECSEVDVRRLRTRLIVEKVRANGGLTPEERTQLKELVDKARRKQRDRDQRILRGLNEQRAREERANRLTGY